MSLLLRSSRLAVLALAAAGGTQAAELGDASVRSFAGQPLAADIELTDLTAQEMSDLQVRLARPDVFQGASVKMNPALAGAAISIVRRDSRRVLHVTTSAPVQAEVLHLYFQLVSGGKERVRSVTLWLSPAPAIAPVVAAVPAPAPAVVANAPAAAAPAPSTVGRAGRPAVHRAGGDTVAGLVALASPGKEATGGEREMLDAVERAFSARGGKVALREEKKEASTPGRQEVRKEALKHASSADDFRRGAKPAKPAVAKNEPEKETAKDHAKDAEPQGEKKVAARSILPSKADLAEAARATRASVEAGVGAGKDATGQERLAAAPASVSPARPAAGQPAAVQPATVQPAAAQADAAMLNKLAELEGKLKTLQAQLGISNTAGAARVAMPAAGKAEPAAPEAPKAAAPANAPAQMAGAAKPGAAAIAAAPAAATDVPAQVPAAPAVAHAAVQATAAADETVKPGAAQPGEPGAEQVTASAATTSAAVATVEEPKPKPEEKKAAEPPPPAPKKEIKISRPKLLTFLFAGSLVLLAIFGVIVHFIRKAKMRRSPIVRQSWSRDDDDAPARTEPTAGPVPAPGVAAPLKG